MKNNHRFIKTYLIISVLCLLPFLKIPANAEVRIMPEYFLMLRADLETDTYKMYREIKYSNQKISYPDDPNEEIPGACVHVNNDYDLDPADKIISDDSWGPNEIVTERFHQENDFCMIHMNLLPLDIDGKSVNVNIQEGKITLEKENSKIRIWWKDSKNQKYEPLLGDGGELSEYWLLDKYDKTLNNRHSRDFFEHIKDKLYVEGMERGTCKLTLSYFKDENDDPESIDTITFNIFSPHRIYIEDNIACVLPGETAVAKGYPDNSKLTWTIEETSPSDGTVKAWINSITGEITVEEDTESGTITIRATDDKIPCECCYIEKEVSVGCPTCDPSHPELCSSVEGGGSVTNSDSGNDLRISVGKGSGGQSAGEISLTIDQPSPDMATPKALDFSSLVKDGVDALYGRDGTIRQILAPRSFVNIVTNNDFSYDIRYYRPDVIIRKAYGFYEIDPNKDPFVTWRIENPDASFSVYNRLRITEIKDGSTKAFEYAWDDAKNAWSLNKGNGLKIETRAVDWDTVLNNRVVTHTIKDASNHIALIVQTTYHQFEWGEGVIKEVVDPDNAALTTITNYYEDQGNTGNYGRIRSIVNPDGSWTRYEYDEMGRKIKEIRPWLDSPVDVPPDSAHTFYYDYNPVDSDDINSSRFVRLPRTVTEKILGTIVSKTYYAYLTNEDNERIEITERCANPGASYGNSSNLRTITVYYPSGTDLPESGKVKSILYPDGRFDTYAYENGRYIPKANPAEGIFLPGKGKDVRATVTYGTVNHPEGIAYKTTREISIQDQFGHELIRETYVYTGSTYERIQWSAQYHDGFGRVIKVINSDGTQTDATWSCCAKESETDSRGITRIYSYDDLQRLDTVIKEGITVNPWPAQSDIYTTYTYDAAGRQLTETITSGSLSLATSNEYDISGRLLKITDSAGLVTSYQYEHGGRDTTVTRPGGATEITTSYFDGRIKSLTGTGVIAQYFQYGVNTDGTQWTVVYTGSMNSPRWEKTTTDILGRTIKTEKPGFSLPQAPAIIETTQSHYNNKGQLIRVISSGLADTLFEHDELGSQIRSGQDVNKNGNLDLASNDRINESDTSYALISGIWWQENIQRIYATENAGTSTTTGIQRTQITGLGTGGKTEETISIDIHGNQVVNQGFINRNNKAETRITNYPDSTTNDISISINGLLVSSQDKTGIEFKYNYDPLGRRTGVTNPRTGTTITHYNIKGQIDYIEDPAGNRTSYAYDSATGRRISETNALNKAIRYSYNNQGQITHTWGDTTYPVRYVYDAYGQMTEMHTYRDGTNWNSETWPVDTTGTTDVTKWHYDEATGLLVAKEDAESKSVSYTYNLGGRLATRTWARTDNNQPLVTTYIYDDNTGELLSIDYSDSTPDITFTYDRLGRQKAITDAIGFHTFTYNSTLQLASETITGLYNKVITRSYESESVKGRSTGFSLGTDYTVIYGYEISTGRFSTVGWNVAGKQGSANYSYVQNSDLISQYSFSSPETATNLVTTYSYEAKRDFRTQVKNEYGVTLISQYDYNYDQLGRRTSVSNSGQAFNAVNNAFNLYNYNDRSELTESSRYLGSNISDTSSPVQPEYRNYTYDHIGNREESIDWDNATSDLRTSTYTSNSLNQYTQQAISNDGTNNFTYDDDGNLTSVSSGTSVTQYTYNAENRLTIVTPEIPVEGDKKVEFMYDYMGRRVRKKVYVWEAGTWAEEEERLFVYERWNLIAEMIIQNGQQTVKYYVWGQDLSGTLQGAGGVGGLLSYVDSSSSSTYYYLYDVNGNVGQLMVGDNGQIVAHYEQDPFGKEIVTIGSAVEENVFRFSTKYFDEECGLYCYGYRCYDTYLGRWLNRDPIREEGSFNLYAFVQNNCINTFDAFGLYKHTEHEAITRSGLAHLFYYDMYDPEKIMKIIIKANRSQDEDFFLVNFRHYNMDVNYYKSPSVPERIAADAMYEYYLKTEEDNFNKYLEKPNELNCINALISLGLLTHSWEDFFSHAIPRVNNNALIPVLLPHSINIVNIKSFEAFSVGVTGTPSNRKDFWPSTYSFIPGFGEHPTMGEPVVKGTEEYTYRYNAAISYVLQVGPEYISKWWDKCKCWFKKKNTQ